MLGPERAALLTVTACGATSLPVLRRVYRRVLDVGCGANPVLEALDLPADTLRVGVDPDRDAIKAAARGRAPGTHFVVADGQALPFHRQSFDLVMSRSAIPYMDVPTALREKCRVLRDGGSVWMTVHPVRAAVMRIVSDVRALRIKDLVYQSYAILNGLSLHWWGRQFRFPLRRRRIESVQTLKGITRAMREAGFRDVQYEIRSRGPGQEARDKLYGKLFALAAWKDGCTRG